MPDLPDNPSRPAALDPTALGKVVLEQAPVIVVLLDLSGTVLDVNRHFETLTGWALEEARGKDWFATFLPAAVCEQTRRLFLSSVGGTPTRGNINAIVTRSGEEREIEWNDELYRDDAGHVVGVLALGIDVTARVLAERGKRARENELRTIAEHLPVSFCYVDKHQRYRFANRVHAEALGISAEATLGKTVRQIIGDPLYKRVQPAIAQVLSGQRVSFVETYEQPDGSTVSYDIRLVPDFDSIGDVAGYFSLVQDVSDLARAEMSQRESERRLNDAQRIAQIGSWDLDLKTNVLRWSDEVFRMLEIDPAHFGATYEAFLAAVHPDDRAFVNDAYTRSVATREPYEITHRVLMPDGRIKFVRERCETSYGIDGEPLRSLGTAQDITEHIRVERALRTTRDHLEATLQAIPDLLFEVDSEGRYASFRAVNPSLLIRPPEDFLGRSMLEVLPPDSAAVVTKALAEAAKTGTSFGHVYSLDLGGTRKWFELSVARKVDAGSGAPSFVALARDITDRKRAEDAVLALNAQLEARVRERTARLEVANRELETFTYSVSHDLKAPLRSIDGYSRLVLREYGSKLDQEGQRLLQNVRGAANLMNRLIDDLLAYSQIERRNMQAESINVAALIEALVAERVEEIAARGIQVVVTGLCPSVSADRHGLTIALRNLIENAVKFTRNVPNPTIEIGDDDHPDSCVLWVRDNGLGFDMRFHDRIFEIFQRLERSEDYPGTGVGLAIVSKAAERMGGRVWAQSEVGRGATFYLEVPK